jgi:hypothetical protein
LIALTNDQQITIEFHQLLQDKLYLSNLQSCNSKDELDYYIKPKDTLIALHDNFLRYGTKKATSFLIIDVDNINKPLEKYYKEVKYKLGGTEPNWICKTDKGFHIGFILDMPIWLNNDIKAKQAQEIKRDLTILLNGDIAGSHRLIGYWRNPLTHQSTLNLKLHNLDELHKIAMQQYFSSFSLFDNIYEHQKKLELRKKDKIQIAKSNWEQIDKEGFTQGNRNNFLFNKIIGMLYNGLITNDEVLITLKSINDNVLDDKEIQKIAKSILKYNIKPIQQKQNIRRSKGVYHQDLWNNQIHNYKEKNKTIFARQQIGQKISTAKIIEKTINKLVKGYLKIYQDHERFLNRIIEINSKVDTRTIQRYRNNRKIEDIIKAKAFNLYLESLAPQGVMPDDTPINEIVNLILKNMEYHYLKTNKVFKFKINKHDKLIFYDTGQSNELLAA